MTETLFERYKEALRAGHVAARRGRFEEAATAYRAAIAIAGDRAVPRAALGGVCLRLGDPDGALAAYEAALALDPDDDGALLGRAQAFVVLRRTADAAATYDRLASVREAGGRRADATEAARRALAIEPDEARRARHAALSAPVGGDDAAAAGKVAAGETTAPATPGEPVPDPEALLAAAEEAVVRGDAGTAAAAALAAARAYRATGQAAAAFDAGLVGIGARPADVDLHLLLAELAVERGWDGRAAATWRDLLRLAELDGDAIAEARVRAAAAAHPAPGGAAGD